MTTKEILVTKAYTIGRRGSFKDYIDIYTGLKSGLITLAETIDLAGKKYHQSFNDRLFIEQLLYLNDLEEEPLIMLSGHQPTKNEIESFFKQEISAFKL